MKGKRNMHLNSQFITRNYKTGTENAIHQGKGKSQASILAQDPNS